MVNSLLRRRETFQECFHSSSHQAGAVCRLHGGLICHHITALVLTFSSFPKMDCDSSSITGRPGVLGFQAYLIDSLSNPSHKAALFAWFGFNTPLSAQLASLGNISHHHPPDPGFKIASYPQTNTQEGISKKKNEEERKSWHETAMHDKLNTAASSFFVGMHVSTMF